MKSKEPLEFALSEGITPEEIHALRRRLGLTQRDFASALGVSVKTIERWETDDKPVVGPVVTLARILWEYPQIIDRLTVPPLTMPHRYWYSWREYRCTLIDVDDRKRQIMVKDFTLDRSKKAFGVISAPTYEDFEELVAYRCGISGLDGAEVRRVFREKGLSEYDLVQLLRITGGRLASDEFSLILAEEDKTEG